MWPFTNAHRWYVSREFPRASANAGSAGTNPSERTDFNDQQDHLRHLRRGIEIYVEWRIANAQSNRPDHGGNRRTSPGNGGKRNQPPRNDRIVSCPAAPKGDGRNSQAG